MILGFGNNLVSSLASDITASQTAIPVMPGDGTLFATLLTSDFSNKSTMLKNYAKITLTDAGETAFEICHLISVSGDTLTVIRGQEGTAAKGWSLKDVIANFATRGSENIFPQIAHIQSGFYTSGIAGGSANALTLELPSTFFLNGSAEWVLKTPLVVYPSQNNTAAATLQLTMGGKVLGTFPLYKGNKAQLVANDILKDVGLVCLLDNSKTFFNVANPGAIYAGLGTAAYRDVTTSATDTTAGRVLVVGDHGLGGAARETTVSKETVASFWRDAVEVKSGITIPFDGTPTTNYFAIDGANHQAYIGRQRSGAGISWVKLYSEYNKPSAADVDAVSASQGGTFQKAIAVKGNGANLSLWSLSANQAAYVLGKDYNGDNVFYVGRGSANYNVSLYNYKANNGLILNEDGSVALSLANGKTFTVNGQVVPSTYANFDARYQGKSQVSIATNGWSKTADGLLIQWGTTPALTAGQVYTVPLPAAVPNAILSAVASVKYQGIASEGNMGTYVNFSGKSLIISADYTKTSIQAPRTWMIVCH